VGVRIREGEKERVQDYQGVIIAMANHGLHKSITVRARRPTGHAGAAHPQG